MNRIKSKIAVLSIYDLFIKIMKDNNMNSISLAEIKQMRQFAEEWK